MRDPVEQQHRRACARCGDVHVQFSHVHGAHFDVLWPHGGLRVPLLRALRVEHPGISVELAVGDRLAELVAENIDLAVRSGVLGDSNHVAKRLGDTPLVTVASAGYLARHGEPKDLAELADHDCLVFFTRGARRAWRFGRPTAASLHPTRAAFCSSSADDIRAAVLTDLGLAQVPGWLVARDLATGAVRAVLRSHEPAPIPLSLIRPQRRVPDRVRVVEQFLSREIARTLIHDEREAG